MMSVPGTGGKFRVDEPNGVVTDDLGHVWAGDGAGLSDGPGRGLVPA
jgi:hypothetical protein